MAYTPTNWVDGATPLNRTNMMKIENELAALDTQANAIPPPTYGTTPPASPVNGQIWFWNFTSGVTWQMRYNSGSADANKWEFVGGPEYVGFASDTLGMGNSWASYFPGATAGRSGLYGVYAQIPNATAQGATLLTFGVGISGVDTVPYYLANSWQNNAGQQIGISPAGGWFNATAGQVFVILGHGGIGGVTLTNRQIHMYPIRVS